MPQEHIFSILFWLFVIPCSAALIFAFSWKVMNMSKIHCDRAIRPHPKMEPFILTGKTYRKTSMNIHVFLVRVSPKSKNPTFRLFTKLPEFFSPRTMVNIMEIPSEKALIGRVSWIEDPTLPRITMSTLSCVSRCGVFLLMLRRFPGEKNHLWDVQTPWP